MAEIKIGDVVILKSGDPAMTVQNVADYPPMGPNPGVSCVWFDGLKKIEDVFHINTVEHYDLHG